MANTKPKIQDELTKEKSGTISSTGVRTGPRLTHRHDIKASTIKEILIPADSMKN